MRMSFYAIALALAPIAMNTTPVFGQAESSAVAAAQTRERRSPWVAAGLEWLVPFAGHSYAGDVRRGVPSNSLRLTGAVVILIGFVAFYSSDCSTKIGFGPCDSSTEHAVITAGLLALAGGTVWATISASETARDHNRMLADRVRVIASIRPNRFSIGLSLVP